MEQPQCHTLCRQLLHTCAKIPPEFHHTQQETVVSRAPQLYYHEAKHTLDTCNQSMPALTLKRAHTNSGTEPPRGCRQVSCCSTHQHRELQCEQSSRKIAPGRESPRAAVRPSVVAAAVAGRRLPVGPLLLGPDVTGARVVHHLTQDGAQHKLGVVDGCNGQTDIPVRLGQLLALRV